MNKLSLIKELLLQLVARIDAGNCSMTEEDYDKVIEQIKHFSMADTKYSKYQACKYLNMCRATFDNHVRAGDIPEGRKQQGFTELFWYKKDLDKYRSLA